MTAADAKEQIGIIAKKIVVGGTIVDPLGTGAPAIKVDPQDKDAAVAAGLEKLRKEKSEMTPGSSNQTIQKPQIGITRDGVQPKQTTRGVGVVMGGKTL